MRRLKCIMTCITASIMKISKLGDILLCLLSSPLMLARQRSVVLLLLGFVVFLHVDVNDLLFGQAGRGSGVVADLLVSGVLPPKGCADSALVAVNPASGVVFTACSNGDATDGIFVAVGAENHQVANSSQCPAPLAMQFNSKDNLFYAVCNQGSSLEVIDPNTFQITTLSNDLQQCESASVEFITGNNQSIEVYLICTYPHLRPDQPNQFVIQNISWSGQLLDNGSLIGQVDVAVINITFPQSCSPAVYIAINPATLLLYAACRLNTVVAVSLNSSGIQPNVTITNAPVAPFDWRCVRAFNENTGVIYVGCQYLGVLSILNGNFTTLYQSSTCQFFSFVAVNPQNGGVYFSCVSGPTYLLNQTSELVMVTSILSVELCSQPSSASVNSVSGVVYVGCAANLIATVLALNGPITTPVISCKPRQYANFWTDPLSGDVYATCDDQTILMNGYIAQSINISTSCPTSANFPESLYVAVNSSNGVIYTTCAYGNTLAWNETGATLLATWNCGPIAIDPFSAILYTYCTKDPRPGLYNIPLSYPYSRIQMQAKSACNVAALVFNPWTAMLYAACENNKIAAFKNSRFAFYVQIDCSPSALAMNFDQEILYVSCTSSAVFAFKGSTLSNISLVLSQSKCGNGLGGSAVAVHQSTGLVYVLCSGNGVLSMSADGSNLKTIMSPSTCTSKASSQSIAVNAAGLVYASCNGNILVANIATMAPCPVGFIYSAAISSQCTQCAVATYMSYNTSLTFPLLARQNNSCTSCPAGFIANTTGSASCIRCPAGQRAISALACANCSSGYHAEAGSMQCVECDTGRYSLDMSASCLPCSPGSFSSAKASPACIPCAPGQFSSSYGASSCDPCPIGTFSNSTTGASECSPCLAGTIAGFPGSVQCNECPEGTAARANSCVNCPLGQFQNLTSSSTCKLCEVGTYQESNSMQPAAICQSCAPGSFQNSSGQAGCIQCEVGKLSNVTGASECQDCSAGFFAGSAGNNMCQPCQVGTYQFNSGASGCHDCAGIDGIVCLQTLSVLPGWFAYVDDNKLVYTAQCSSTVSCEGSDKWSPDEPIQCGEHRRQDLSNYLCGECDVNFSEVNGKCVKCNGVNVGLLAAVLLGCWIYVVFVHLNSKSKSSGLMTIFIYNLQSALFLTGTFADWTAWLNIMSFTPSSSTSQCILPLTPMESLAVGLLTCLVFFVFNALNFILQLAGHKWIYPFVAGEQYQQHLQQRRSANESYGSTDQCCATDDVQDNQPANSAERFGPPPRCCRSSHALFDFNGLKAYCAAMFREIVKHIFAKVSRRAYIRSTLSLFLFTYAQVTVDVFRYLQCVSVADQNLVYTAPAVSCDSAEYKAWWPLVIALLVGYVIGFPCAIIIRLRFKRKVLHLARAVSMYEAAAIKRARSESAKALASPQNSQNAATAPAAEKIVDTPVSYTSGRENVGMQTVHEEETVMRPGLSVFVPNETQRGSSPQSVVELALLHHHHDRQSQRSIDGAQSALLNPSEGSKENSVANHSKSEVSRFALFWSLFYEAYEERTYFWHAIILIRRTGLIVLYTFLYQYPSERQALIMLLHALFLALNILLRPFRRGIANVLENVNLTLLMLVGLMLTVNPQPPYPVLQQVLLTLLIFIPALFFIFILLGRALIANGLIDINRKQLTSTLTQQHYPDPHQHAYSHRRLWRRICICQAFSLWLSRPITQLFTILLSDGDTSSDSTFTSNVKAVKNGDTSDVDGDRLTGSSDNESKVIKSPVSTLAQNSANAARRSTDSYLGAAPKLLHERISRSSDSDHPALNGGSMRKIEHSRRSHSHRQVMPDDYTHHHKLSVPMINSFHMRSSSYGTGTGTATPTDSESSIAAFSPSPAPTSPLGTYRPLNGVRSISDGLPSRSVRLSAIAAQMSPESESGGRSVFGSAVKGNVAVHPLPMPASQSRSSSD